MITFPRNLDEAMAVDGQFRAGGTDLMERRHMGIAEGPIVDLRDIPDLDRIEAMDVMPGLAPEVADPTPGDPTVGGLRIGALVRLHDVATDPTIAKSYPGLAKSVTALATPQIRNTATLGGSLLQRNRCWYYRNAGFQCFKKGGNTCFARVGDHLYHSFYDLGPCIAIHPSTPAMALLAYGARIRIHKGPERDLAELYGSGSNIVSDHLLGAGRILTSILLPAPLPEHRAAYVRAIARARSEWPLVETLVLLGMSSDSLIDWARVSIGGVANIPLRLESVEEALVGKAPSLENFGRAAAKAVEEAVVVPGNEYKRQLITGSLLDAMHRAAHGRPADVDSE